MTVICNRCGSRKMIKLEVVKVKGQVNWAIKCTVDGVSRYRGYYYKANAVANLPEWTSMAEGRIRWREFMHNFYPADELCIREV